MEVEPDHLAGLRSKWGDVANMEEGKLAASATREAQLTWLEGVMAELLASGVRPEEIAVHLSNDLRIEVMVRGEPRFQYTPPGVKLH